MKIFYFLIIGLILLIQGNYFAFGQSSHKVGDVVIETKTAYTPDGKPISYELGRIFVPENRNAKNSRLISVGFARLRGKTEGTGTPIFLLPGGPGESALTNFTDVDAGSRQRLANFIKYYSSVGDLIVMDQRGFSKYGDVLEFSLPDFPLDSARSLANETAALIKASKESSKNYPNVDFSGYNITQYVEDVNDLRKVLGYRKIILTGQSFGSQWSFAVMKLHPEIVERAQISAVEPLDYTYDMPSHIFAAIQRIAADANQDPKLKPYLPKGGMMEALRVVSNRLKKAPVKVEAKDEETNQIKTVVLGLEDFREGLLLPANMLPAFIISLYHQHYENWAKSVIEERKSTKTSLIGPLIDTSLGVSKQRRKLLYSDPAADILGFGAFETYIDSASAWVTSDMGDNFRLAVLSQIPVVFTNGDWDTSTPIENMQHIKSYFPNSHTILVRRGTHGARRELFDTHPEVLEKVIEFFKTGKMENLPDEMSLPTPSFQLPTFSPTNNKR